MRPVVGLVANECTLSSPIDSFIYSMAGKQGLLIHSSFPIYD